MRNSNQKILIAGGAGKIPLISELLLKEHAREYKIIDMSDYNEMGSVNVPSQWEEPLEYKIAPTSTYTDWDYKSDDKFHSIKSGFNHNKINKRKKKNKNKKTHRRK